MNNKVLLLDGGGTQTLPIARSLYRKGHTVYIFYNNKWSYGYGTRFVSHKVKSPSIYDEDSYLAFFKEFVVEKSIEVVVPMSDPSALFLSKFKESLLKICNFIAPDFQSFITGYDKNLLMTVCRENDFPHPRTIDMKEVDISTIDDTIFPSILKPNLTTGGRGMKILKSRQELELVYQNNVKEFGDCHLQKFVAHGGRQFKVELFLNDQHQMINSSVIHKQRFYPVSGGSSCFNTTVQFDELVDICYAVLKKIMWVGFADFDLIEDPKDGIIKIMEINPRIPACIESAIRSGIDYGNNIVDSSMGRNIIKYDYVPGKQCRHLGFDILWFLKSKDRFKVKPAWFNFFNKNQSFQDFSFIDPIPFVFGTIGNIKKIMSSGFRKSKSMTTQS